MAPKKKQSRRGQERASAPEAVAADPPPRAPLVSMGDLARWALPGLALLLWTACWIRFAQVAANNRPPLRLLALEGDEPWPTRELLRTRCSFNGQFLAVGDRVWIPCATGPRTWELMRWDFARGVAERRWRATCSPKDSSTVEVVSQQGLPLPPIIAAAVRLSVGDLALVLHGQKPLTPVELVVARRQGGLAHHPLPGIKPGALVGFARVDDHYELLTADCRRHVLAPGKPLMSAPLAGCPYDERTVLEWSEHHTRGWRFVYARQSGTPGRYALFLVEAGAHSARPIGTLAEATKTLRGEKLDMSPGNVLPVAMSQWPTHRLVKSRPSPLERPPRALSGAADTVSPGGKQILLLGPSGLRRLYAWHAMTTGAARPTRTAAGDRAPGRSIHRWRWLVRQPTRWIAGERLEGEKVLRLTADAPERTSRIPLPHPPPAVLSAIPAKGGGTWLFDSLGTYLKVDDGLRRADPPGLGDRLRRLWRLHHLQRTSLSGPPGRPEAQPRLLGHAHRAALPVVLLGLPLLALLALPLARRRGRALDPARPLRASLARPVWPWLLAAALYLAAAGALMWSFWEVTAAL